MNQAVIRTERLGKLYEFRNRRGLVDLRERCNELLRESFRTMASRSLRPRAVLNGELWALRNVSMEIHPGDVVGIMGRNGSGKTTLLKILARVSEPTEGAAMIRGRVGTLMDVGAGLHGELTGAENVYLNAATHGMQRNEIRDRFDEIVAFAELEKSMDQPLKYFSSGMCLRLAFTVAAFLPSSVLLVDEVLAQADPAFQTKCLEKMTASASGGQVVLFVSHDMECIRRFCTRGIVFREGEITHDGPASQIVDLFAPDCAKPIATEEDVEVVSAERN